jgi:hypothetical protein
MHGKFSSPPKSSFDYISGRPIGAGRNGDKWQFTASREAFQADRPGLIVNG